MEKPENIKVGMVAHWKNACLACMRARVLSPAAHKTDTVVHMVITALRQENQKSEVVLSYPASSRSTWDM